MNDQELIQIALTARKSAYAPYSHYQVGAALLAKSGQVFTGCNVENAVYPLCTCAERTAVVKAVSEGQCEFAAIAIATRNGGSPCGSCRQVLREFAPHIRILLVDGSNRVREFTLDQLLPESFGPESLA